MGGERREGIVVRAHQSHYVVESGGDEILCAISSKLRKNLEYPEASPASRHRSVQSVREIMLTAAVVVGDRVVVEPGDELSMIVEVLPRRTIVSREAAGRRYREQIIAANVDQVIAVQSTRTPQFDSTLLDRTLAGAEYEGLEARIVLNKADLGVSEDVAREIAAYEPIGYPIIHTSAATGEGIGALGNALRGKTSVLVGLSGVGKSSLGNALQPGLDLRVQEVSARTGLGKHTTTHVSLIALDSGGYLVDAPGLRELSLFSAEPDDIEYLFREFVPLIGACRFGTSCAHGREPGCAIKEAVAAGAIAAHRHAHYLTLRREADVKAVQLRERRRPRPPG